MLEMKLVQPTGLYELLLIGQSDTNQPATGYSNVELLPPLVRASIAAQTRGFHTSRALASRAFQPTSPCLFPAGTKSKDAAAAPPKAPAPAPKASAGRGTGRLERACTLGREHACSGEVGPCFKAGDPHDVADMSTVPFRRNPRMRMCVHFAYPNLGMSHRVAPIVVNPGTEVCLRIAARVSVQCPLHLHLAIWRPQPYCMTDTHVTATSPAAPLPRQPFPPLPKQLPPSALRSVSHEPDQIFLLQYAGVPPPCSHALSVRLLGPAARGSGPRAH